MSLLCFFYFFIFYIDVISLITTYILNLSFQLLKVFLTNYVETVGCKGNIEKHMGVY